MSPGKSGKWDLGQCKVCNTWVSVMPAQRLLVRHMNWRRRPIDWCTGSRSEPVRTMPGR